MKPLLAALVIMLFCGCDSKIKKELKANGREIMPGLYMVNIDGKTNICDESASCVDLTEHP